MPETPPIGGVRLPPAWLVSAALALILVVAAGVALGRSPSGWLSVVLALAAGAAAATAGFSARFLAPLSRVADACRSVESGDLSLTVPEPRVGELRLVAGTINAMAADFQEVLLLFAHMVRSARRSVSLIEEAAAAGRSEDELRLARAAIIDIAQMQDVISEFKYFRVSIEGDTILDTGVAPARATAADPGSAARAASSLWPSARKSEAGGGGRS